MWTFTSKTIEAIINTQTRTHSHINTNTCSYFAYEEVNSRKQSCCYYASSKVFFYFFGNCDVKKKKITALVKRVQTADELPVCWLAGRGRLTINLCLFKFKRKNIFINDFTSACRSIDHHTCIHSFNMHVSCHPLWGTLPPSQSTQPQSQPPHRGMHSALS